MTQSDASTPDPLERTSNVEVAEYAPAGASVFGMFLLLASLTMLFLAGVIGYVVIRLRTEGVSVEIPIGLWISTLIIVVSSAALHYSELSLKADHRRAFRNALITTLGLGAIFVAVQGPSLYSLAGRHQEAVEQQNVYVYALIVFLIVLHALHVIGGVIPMAITAVKAAKGRYSATNREGVRRLCMYWHFLGVVWIVLFSAFVILG
jgi:cytochrome c oxidase subunit 3